MRDIKREICRQRGREREVRKRKERTKMSSQGEIHPRMRKWRFCDSHSLIYWLFIVKWDFICKFFRYLSCLKRFITNHVGRSASQGKKSEKL